jgi:hypothetical protein
MAIYHNSPYQGTLGTPTNIGNNDHILINGNVHRIHRVQVHEFKMGDVEDPDLYAAQPLYDWQTSEMGEWVMSRAVDTPEWHRQIQTLPGHDAL